MWVLDHTLPLILIEYLHWSLLEFLSLLCIQKCRISLIQSRLLVLVVLPCFSEIPFPTVHVSIVTFVGSRSSTEVFRGKPPVSLRPSGTTTTVPTTYPGLVYRRRVYRWIPTQMWVGPVTRRRQGPPDNYVTSICLEVLGSFLSWVLGTQEWSCTEVVFLRTRTGDFPLTILNLHKGCQVYNLWTRVTLSQLSVL